MDSQLPVLYSFRRCPYAMRARISLLLADIPVVLREIDLKNKHPVFLQTSPKGTVPVLVLPNGEVIDESIAIVNHAYGTRSAATQPTHGASHTSAQPLSAMLDSHFIKAVTRLKYHERYTTDEVIQAQHDAATFLSALEANLAHQAYLAGHSLGRLDVVIFPFVRQLYRSDTDRFMALPYPHTQRWMLDVIESTVFKGAMIKTKVWEPEQPPLILKKNK